MRRTSLAIATALLLSGTSAFAMEAAVGPQLAQNAGGAGGGAAGSGTAGTKGYQARELLEMHSDGPMTMDQMQAYSDEAFVGYDADGDGYISGDEWMFRSESLMEQGDTSAELDIETYATESLGIYDIDGDGQVSRDEWNLQTGNYYHSLDTNQDNALDEAEIDAGRSTM